MKIKKGNLLIGFIQVISIIIIIISLYYIYLWYIDNKKTENILNEIYENANVSSDNISVDNDLKIEVENIDFNKLINKNPDTIGWIKVLGTDINYPVVQTNNNDFYLTHSFDKSYNKAGWIFADYRNKFDNTDKNIVIYGHNMRDGSMFGSMLNCMRMKKIPT